VFVLDMGDPVKIIDLARNMIRLSGKQPRLPGEETTSSRDIQIAYVGARQGEKVHEELWGDHESVAATAHPKILRLSRPPVESDGRDVRLGGPDGRPAEGTTLGGGARLGAIVPQPDHPAATLPPASIEPSPLEVDPRLTRDTNL